MCGISGIFSFSENGKNVLPTIYSAVEAMQSRGPDSNGVFTHENIALGHNRLSVIDTSEKASQPFTDISGRYTIVFNGEFYNYKNYRSLLISQGVQLNSFSDTEVLLNLFMLEGERCLSKINGFFALAIYDKQQQSIFLARDRYGVKPLYYYANQDVFCFASEMKGLIAMNIPRTLDTDALAGYLLMNYTPAHATMLKDIHKVQPGTYLYIKKNKIVQQSYYSIPFRKNSEIKPDTYESATNNVKKFVRHAVHRRLVSDVPLGAFLSGGIDSSIVVALASEEVQSLKTFSIGFKDAAYYDETRYAELVAAKYKTEHTSFSLSNEDLLESLNEVLAYMDDPFADSSAIALNALCKRTRHKITVALSGDGADELFGGYRKHMAEVRIYNAGSKESLLKLTNPLIHLLPQSRNNVLSDKIRQMVRFSDGMKLSAKERYWRWCSIQTESGVGKLIRQDFSTNCFTERKNNILSNITNSRDLNEILLTDMQHVLVNDMLVKVDMSSMANSLEVRNPFLDKDLVNYVFSLPASMKTQKNSGKIILKGAFKEMLPDEILNRPKHGFEVPLLPWFRNDLYSWITNDLLNEEFIVHQNIFDPNETKALLKRLLSKNPGDAPATLWALIVFQHWWKKYMDN
jgi:asparagine synthase (glutamine-hydrolysing)